MPLACRSNSLDRSAQRVHAADPSRLLCGTCERRFVLSVFLRSFEIDRRRDQGGDGLVLCEKVNQRIASRREWVGLTRLREQRYLPMSG